MTGWLVGWSVCTYIHFNHSYQSTCYFHSRAVQNTALDWFPKDNSWIFDEYRGYHTYVCHLYFFFRKIMFCKYGHEKLKKKLSGNWSLCCIKCPQLNWVNHLHKLGRGGEAWRAESGQEGRGHVYLARDAKQEHGPTNYFKMQQASLW